MEKKGKATATDWVCRETSPEEGEKVVFEKVEGGAIPLINVENKFQAPTSTDKLTASIDAVVEVAAATSEEGPKKAGEEDEELEQMVCECKAAKPEGGENEVIFVENCGGQAIPVINVEKKPQGPTFSDKLAENLKEVAEVSTAVITVGYKKAEAFVQSKEFKQDVATTKAVAGGLYRGFGKLVKEVKQSVEAVKNKEIPKGVKDKTKEPW